MARMLQMRRSRGAASGSLLVLLGLWGALVPAGIRVAEPVPGPAVPAETVPIGTVSDVRDEDTQTIG